jgi:tetratricopeptide (TPR) repeat protein
MKTRTLTGFAVLLLLAFVSVPVVRPQGQERATAPAADKKNDSKEWSQKEPPRDAEEWFARGHQMHSSDRYPEAIESFKRAADLGYRKATAMYNIACGYSLLNDKENALAWLQKALDNGFVQADLIADDSDLDPIRSDARFKKIVAGFPANLETSSRRKAKAYANADRLEQANLDFIRLDREKSEDGQQWSKVGVRLLMLRDSDRSVVALNRAVSLLNYKGSDAMYNLACAYSLKGERDAGLEWLEKAVNNGFDNPEKLRNDPDINNLRSDARFARIDKLSNTLTLSQFHENRDRSNDDEKYMFSRERWAPAITLYESFLKNEPNSGRAWFNLGYARHYSREHSKAIEAFERAISLGYHAPVATYNIACAYAMLNQKDAAFEWLDRAVKAGFDSKGDFSWDSDLDNLRSDPRFRRFIESANRSNRTEVEL